MSLCQLGDVRNTHGIQEILNDKRYLLLKLPQDMFIGAVLLQRSCLGSSDGQFVTKPPKSELAPARRRLSLQTWASEQSTKKVTRQPITVSRISVCIVVSCIIIRAAAKGSSNVVRDFHLIVQRRLIGIGKVIKSLRIHGCAQRKRLI